VLGAAAMAGFSRLPVHEGDLDHIIGFVYMKDLLRQQHMGWPMELRKLVRPALLVPETIPLDRLLQLFRERRSQIAIVLDEFGGTEGLVTLEDVLEELVGEIHDEYRQDRSQDIVRRDARSWLVDANVSVDDFLAHAGLEELRTTSPREFSTVGGLIIHALGRIPRIGDRTQWQGLYLEVVDMDGPRIDRLLITTHQAKPKG
jgi:putative hemolysin